MPTYDYVCDTCEKTFEVFQSIKDDRLTECPDPECPGKVKRKISGGAGLIFKGSGFYQTDYRSDSYNAGAKADKSASSSSSSSSAASTPSTPSSSEAKSSAPSAPASSSSGGDK